jgi:hypothetical protein
MPLAVPPHLDDGVDDPRRTIERRKAAVDDLGRVAADELFEASSRARSSTPRSRSASLLSLPIAAARSSPGNPTRPASSRSAKLEFPSATALAAIRGKSVVGLTPTRTSSASICGFIIASF